MSSVACPFSFKTITTIPDLSAKWIKVHVNKLDEKGNVSENDKVYVANQTTGELYYDDPKVVVWTKSAMIAIIGAPIYTVGYMIWNTVKIAVDICSIAFIAFNNLYKDLSASHSLKSFKPFLVNICLSVPKSIFFNVFNVVKAPFLGLALEAAACLGLFNPYEGRSLVAKIEKVWQNGVSYKNDFRFTHSEGNGIQAFCQDVKASKAFYLAFCFQVRGNLNDTKKYKLIKKEPVQCS